MIFLLDKSGSMAGSAWTAVQDCISIFLRSLPTKCYFNVILYDSSYRKIFPKSVEYSQETMKVSASFTAIPFLVYFWDSVQRIKEMKQSSSFCVFAVMRHFGSNLCHGFPLFFCCLFLFLAS